MIRLQETRDTKQETGNSRHGFRVTCHLSLVTCAQGFTLVELLVVIFVMSIIAGVGGDVLISTMRSSNKANIINEINQNANFVVSTIGSVMRNGKQAQMDGLDLYIIDQYNQKNYFCFKNILPDLNLNAVYRSSQPTCPALSSSTLTNTNAVSGVSVVLPGSFFSVSTDNPPLVTVTLKLTQGPNAPGRIDYQADSTFTKSFELRKY